MDPLHFLTQAELIEFFHCKKTEMSCIEEPHIFLSQLRDHNLVPELLYQKVIKMKSKERRRAVVYEILDRVEKKKHGRCVKRFWSCVFQNHILQKYPVLRILQNSLLDGSFKVHEKLPDAEEPNKPENKDESVQEEGKKVKGKKGGEKRTTSVEEAEEEEPGPSTCSSPTWKKASKKPIFTSPVQKGQKAKIWTWALYKKTLPVTCGDIKGTLYRDKLARGTSCILCNGRWFTPNGFETFAGKGSSKNWKISIRCQKTPLKKLLKEGHLQCKYMKRRCAQKSRRILFPVSLSESSSPESDSNVEESNRDQQEERAEDENQGENEDEEDDKIEGAVEFEAAVLPVSCGSVTGELYKKRFSGGSRSKSIRTEERWFTPEELVESTLRNGNWKRDIRCHGKTLNYLLKKKVLFVHYLLCKCDCCHPGKPLDQNNDDVCFICNLDTTDRDDDQELVCCDECPRAFHLDCHLPTMQNNTNGDQWMCTFCVWKCCQRMWDPMSLEEAFNSPVTQNVMRCQYLMLCLYKEDMRRVLTYDPSTTVPGYSSVISNPMWLDRVKTKLQEKVYSKVGEFVDDIRLIFQNWKTFNGDEDSRLSEIFEQKFLISFKIK